jgi:GMP synthase (glutamine-hydrolysing)
MPEPADANLSPGGEVILVLRAGDAIAEVAAQHGEFASWIARGAGDIWRGGWAEHDLRTSESFPDPTAYAAVIITGSIASVTEEALWMKSAAAYIRAIVGSRTPLLGICFGHQLMAYALGGEVQPNPRGREIGTVALSMSGDDPIVAGLPRLIAVNSSHLDTVKVLPPGAAVIASTVLDDHAIVAFGEAARGVQFHPEMDEHVMRGYVQARRACLLEAGLDAEAILAQASDTPVAREILRNFIRHFVLASLRRAA